MVAEESSIHCKIGLLRAFFQCLYSLTFLLHPPLFQNAEFSDVPPVRTLHSLQPEANTGRLHKNAFVNIQWLYF